MLYLEENLLQPIRTTTLDLGVTRHQNGISAAGVSQTSFDVIVASRNGGCFPRLWNRLFGLDALTILEARKFDSIAGNFTDKNSKLLG